MSTRSARALRRTGRAPAARFEPLMVLRTLATALVVGACGPASEPDDRVPLADTTRVAAALEREMSRLRATADSIDAIFQPLPLLRPAEAAALRRVGNDAQLAVARRLGVSPDITASELQRAVAAGRVVRLADSTDLWVVRELDHSSPFLTRDAEALLRELAQRFQAALDELGAPRFRLEVTSVLRTAEDQTRLRRVNPNAAAGPSTHQYATTFDVAYSAFAAPARPIVRPDVPEPWLSRHLQEVAASMAETTAARRSRELMAVLGKILLQLQAEGAVLVTLEELQPVYHLTVARPLTAPGTASP